MIWTWRNSNPDWSWESGWEFLDGHSVENTQPKEKENEGTPARAHKRPQASSSSKEEVALVMPPRRPRKTRRDNLWRKRGVHINMLARSAGKASSTTP